MTACESPQSWFALAGVVIGFGLGEGSRLARYWWEVYRNKRLVKAELRAVLAQVPQKLDILSQALDALKRQHLLPMLSVHAVASGYQSVLADLYPHLTELERNCLHVIYERLRVADEFMDSFEQNLLKAAKDDAFPDVWEVFITKSEEMVASYGTVTELANSYLRKSPIDVFRIRPNGP